MFEGLPKMWRIFLFIFPIFSHVQSEVPKRIYFLHVHKAGGTSLCSIARMNKNAPNISNCNLVSSNQSIQRIWLMKTQAEVISAIEESPYDFFAIEQHIGTYFMPDRYDYIGVFRDPLDRILSQFKHELYGEPALKFDEVIYRAIWAENLLLKYITSPALVQTNATEALYVGLNRLRQFKLVIAMETYNQGVKLLGPIFGFKHVPDRRAGLITNSGGARDTVFRNRPDLYAATLKKNAEDLVFYDAVRKISREQIELYTKIKE